MLLRRILIGVGAFAALIGHVAHLAAWQEAPAGFVSLFDGKSLTGWKAITSPESLADKPATPKKRITVSDGIMHLHTSKDSGLEPIRTLREWKNDVRIRFEFLPDPRCNNDIFFFDVKFDIKAGAIPNLKQEDWNVCEIVFENGEVEYLFNGQSLKKAVPKKGVGFLAIYPEMGTMQIRNLAFKEAS